MTKTLYIDADSLIYTVLWGFKDSNQSDKVILEEAYIKFDKKIQQIKQAVTTRMQSIDQDIWIETKTVFSPTVNFRHRMFPAGITFDSNGKDLGYKANRKGKSSPIDSELIKELKRMVIRRLEHRVIIHPEAEADDIVVYWSKQPNTYIAAIDKDVLNASRTIAYDYKKQVFTDFMSEEEVKRWYLIQTLTGDSADNIAGAKGIGPKKAEEIVSQLDDYSIEHIYQYFDSEADAIMTYQLINMDYFNGKDIIVEMPE